MERIRLNTGYKTYEIVNLDGDVIGALSFNPSDAGILERYEAVVEEIQKIADDFSDMNSVDRFTEAQKIIEEKMRYLIGEEAASALFSINAPLSPLENGDLYIQHVLEVIGGVIEKETSKRMKRAEKKMNQYLKDYQK